jgi:putative membrane protein
MTLSLETLRWVLAAHIVGFAIWIGSMFGTLHLLFAHAGAVGETRAVLSGLEKRTAMAMDIGAALAIVTGVLMLAGIEPSPFAATWMKLKLALAAGLIGLHGFLRVKVKKFGQGDQRALPGALQGLLPALFIAVVVLAIVRP